MYFFFFFQAEDGIRDGTVTGVQTCALPIFADLAHLERLLPVGRRKRLVELSEIAFRELDVGGAAVLSYVLRVGGLRDRDDPILADNPRERDLDGGRVVPFGDPLEHWMRIGEQSLFNRRICDDRAMPPAHPGQKVPLDAAPLEVVEHLVRGDALEPALETRELLHVVDVEVADSGVADLLRLEEIGESREGLLQWY